MELFVPLLESYIGSAIQKTDQALLCRTPSYPLLPLRRLSRTRYLHLRPRMGRFPQSRSLSGQTRPQLRLSPQCILSVHWSSASTALVMYLSLFPVFRVGRTDTCFHSNLTKMQVSTFVRDSNRAVPLAHRLPNTELECRPIV